MSERIVFRTTWNYWVGLAILACPHFIVAVFGALDAPSAWQSLTWGLGLSLLTLLAAFRVLRCRVVVGDEHVIVVGLVRKLVIPLHEVTRATLARGPNGMLTPALYLETGRRISVWFIAEGTKPGRARALARAVLAGARAGR